MVLNLVEGGPVAHAAKQFVKRVPKGTRRIVPTQRAKRRVELAERGMRQMRLAGVTHLEVMKVADRKVKFA